MRASTELLAVAGTFALVLVVVDAVFSPGSRLATSAMTGAGIGIGVFLLRFVDGMTLAQRQEGDRIAKLEERLASLERDR